MGRNVFITKISFPQVDVCLYFLCAQTFLSGQHKSCYYGKSIHYDNMIESRPDTLAAQKVQLFFLLSYFVFISLLTVFVERTGN